MDGYGTTTIGGFDENVVRATDGRDGT